MKSTLTSRPTANPRRTTLVHLTDATELQMSVPEIKEGVAVPALPQSTANPRRTVLMDLPAS